MKKPRSDSRLKTLPAERQAEIAGLLAARSLAEVRATLAEQGLVTSLGALSEFLTWYQLRESLRRREERVAGLLDELKRADPGIAPERLFDLGQSLFGSMAIAEEDAKGWWMTQQTALKRREIEQRREQTDRALELKTRELALQREKFERETAELILKAVRDDRVRDIEASGLSQEEKIRALRTHYFRDVDELEKAGGVALPP